MVLPVATDCLSMIPWGRGFLSPFESQGFACFQQVASLLSPPSGGWAWTAALLGLSASALSLWRVATWRTKAMRSQLERKIAGRTRALQEHSEELRSLNQRLTQEMRHTREADRRRREVEHRLQQSQRLESLGVLAGGIAHDFNNLLVGIMGSAELALSDPQVDRGSALDIGLRDILSASDRAADLCRQMLAYAGKSPFRTSPLDLSETIRSVESLLRTSVPESVELEFVLDAELSKVGADRAQVEQVLVNLVINAAEALDGAGRLVIRTGESLCNGDRLGGAAVPVDIPVGVYSFIEVEDNGSGMSEDVRERIFEPFFTTKFLGRGLGLAAVFGILRRHGGFITVESEPGAGSTFRAYFPLLEQPARPDAAERQLPLIHPRVSGTVLVVDDEQVVRNLAARALESEGFAVVLADGGSEGINTLRALAGDVSCVLLDMSMPQMDGEATLVRMREIVPEVPIIVMSGHAQSHVASRFQRDEVTGFLSKPFAIEQLRTSVRQAVGFSGSHVAKKSQPIAEVSRARPAIPASPLRRLASRNRRV